MIVDTLANHALYPLGPAWERAVAFLQGLDADTPEGRYAIDGDALFAIVMRYDTASPESGEFESHRDYVDIQSVLEGSEGFECDDASVLDVAVPYDAARDAAFYARSAPGRYRIDIRPGNFVLLYPNDAHLAGLIVGGTTRSVKKVVVKVRRTLLG